MFININDVESYLINNFKPENRIYIQDVVPPVDGITQIPNDLSWYGMFAYVTNANVGNNKQTPVSFDVYRKYIEDLLAYFESIGFANIHLVDNVQQMYASYVALVTDVALAGVINITKTASGVTTFNPFSWKPDGGSSVTVNLFTYWNIFTLLAPKVLILYSGIKEMYDNYLKALIIEDGPTANNYITANKILARHYDIGMLISEMNEIVNNTIFNSDGGRVKTQDLHNILDNDGKTEIDLIHYYNYMYNIYRLDAYDALDMLKFVGDIIVDYDMISTAPDLMKVAPSYIRPVSSVDVSVGLQLI